MNEKTSKRNEQSGDEAASIAGRGLAALKGFRNMDDVIEIKVRGLWRPLATYRELRKVFASCLTQTADHPPQMSEADKRNLETAEPKRRREG